MGGSRHILAPDSWCRSPPRPLPLPLTCPRSFIESWCKVLGWYPEYVHVLRVDPDRCGGTPGVCAGQARQLAVGRALRGGPRAWPHMPSPQGPLQAGQAVGRPGQHVGDPGECWQPPCMRRGSGEGGGRAEAAALPPPSPAPTRPRADCQPLPHPWCRRIRTRVLLPSWLPCRASWTGWRRCWRRPCPSAAARRRTTRPAVARWRSTEQPHTADSCLPVSALFCCGMLLGFPPAIASNQGVYTRLAATCGATVR